MRTTTAPIQYIYICTYGRIMAQEIHFDSYNHCNLSSTFLFQELKSVYCVNDEKMEGKIEYLCANERLKSAFK